MCVSRVLCGRMIEHVPFSRFLHLSAHSNPRGGLFSRIQGSAFLVLMLHPIAGVAQGTKGLGTSIFDRDRLHASGCSIWDCQNSTTKDLPQCLIDGNDVCF